MALTGGQTTATKSVSMILKQKQQSRSSGGGRGGGRGGRGGGRGGPSGPTVSDNLNPILPPQYPTAPTPAPLNRSHEMSYHFYKKMARYFSSNHTIVIKTKEEDGFNLNRYTDHYRAALSLKPHLLYRVPNTRFPDELSKTTLSRPSINMRMKRKLEDLPDTDEVEREGSPDKTSDKEDEPEVKQERSLDDIDEMEEDLDDEMDLGTDYNLSYFDNGEGDEEDRDDEDGPTY